MVPSIMGQGALLYVFDLSGAFLWMMKDTLDTEVSL